jgi:hypothetical protein
MMGHREPLKSGDEYDFLTKARHRYGHPCRARKIKRDFSKRVRRNSRCSISAAIMQTEDESGFWDMSWHDVMYQEGDGYE